MVEANNLWKFLETSTGVGWYILGQDQELIGPYTISELQGELLVFVLCLLILC